MLCFLMRDEDRRNLICSRLLESLCRTVLSLPFTFLAIWWLNSPIVAVVPRVANGTLHGMYLQDILQAPGAGSTAAVAYNLSAVFRFHNPSINFKVSFDNAAETWYGGQKLGPDATLESFKLPSGQTMMVPFDGQGQQVVGGKVATMYAEEASRGFFTIQVNLRVVEGCDTYTFRCTLQFPAPTPARAALNLFDGDDCMTVDVQLGHPFIYFFKSFI